MFKNPSLITRIAVGKLIGLLIGVIGFIILPFFDPEITFKFRLGVLLWYTTLGAIIGVFGVFTWHPVFKFSMPWWFRSSLLGGWMNLILVLVSYDQLKMIMVSAFISDNNIVSSPFWIILEGIIVGLIIEYFATRYGGEGAETVDS